MSRKRETMYIIVFLKCLVCVKIKMYECHIKLSNIKEKYIFSSEFKYNLYKESYLNLYNKLNYNYIINYYIICMKNYIIIYIVNQVVYACSRDRFKGV
jgi:hypothetical protein